MSDVYKENYEMRKQIKKMREGFSEIVTRLVCIGGPFNDNCRKFTKAQLYELKPILDIAETFSEEKKGE